MRRFDMYRNVKRSILLIAAVVLTLGVTGLADARGTLYIGASSGERRNEPRRAPVRERPLFQRGQVLDIRGRITADRNQIMVQDQNSPAVFRLVSLRPEQRRDLLRRSGDLIVVRLRVISIQSARVYTARVLEMSRRSNR
jgi:hypothetical protein